MEKNNENELQSLRNALNSFNLKGYEVYQDANKKKATYCFVNIDKEVLTGWWDYIRINHFIMGYGKALTKSDNNYDKLKEDNALLLNALKILSKYVDNLLTAPTRNISTNCLAKSEYLFNDLLFYQKEAIEAIKQVESK